MVKLFAFRQKRTAEAAKNESTCGNLINLIFLIKGLQSDSYHSIIASRSGVAQIIHCFDTARPDGIFGVLMFGTSREEVMFKAKHQ